MLGFNKWGYIHITPMLNKINWRLICLLLIRHIWHLFYQYTILVNQYKMASDHDTMSTGQFTGLFRNTHNILDDNRNQHNWHKKREKIILPNKGVRPPVHSSISKPIQTPHTSINKSPTKQHSFISPTINSTAKIKRKQKTNSESRTV